MPIFPCPNCSQPLAFDENYSGVGFKCPLCGKECIIAKPIHLSHEMESSPKEFSTPKRSWGEFHRIRIFSQVWKIKGRSKIFGLLLVLLLGGGGILKRNDIAEMISGAPITYTPEEIEEAVRKKVKDIEDPNQKAWAEFLLRQEMLKGDSKSTEKSQELTRDFGRFLGEGIDVEKLKEKYTKNGQFDLGGFTQELVNLRMSRKSQ